MKPLEKWKELIARVAALYQQGGKGWYVEAANLAKEALQFAEKVFGADHMYVAEAQENLALIYHSQGRYAETLLSEPNLEGTEARTLSPGQAELEKSLNVLVLRNLADRKYSEAESLFRRALAMKEKNLVPGHPSISKCLGNIAELYCTEGKYAEAESLFKSIRLQRSRPGEQ